MPNRLLERFDKYNQKNKIEVTIRKRGKLGLELKEDDDDDD